HILELGAGHGTVTDRLLKHGKVAAADLSPRCVEVLREKYEEHPDVEVLHGDVADVTEGRTFDSVVLVNVLGHIEDDGDALRPISGGRRRGAPGALFVLPCGGLNGEWEWGVGHYRRYRRGELAALVKGAGFEVVESRYVNGVGAIAWWIVARQLGRFP